MLWNRRLTLALGCGMLIPVISCLLAMEAELPANHLPTSTPDPVPADVCHNDESGTASQTAAAPTAPPPPPMPGGLATEEEDAAEGDAVEGDAVQELAIREILEFRHQQGSLFRGTMLDNRDTAEADKAFLQALRSVVRQQRPPQSPPPDEATEPATASARTRACEAAYTQHLMQQQSASPAVGRLPDETSDEALANTLRQAWRALDRKAQELEDAREYSTAYQLRNLSDELKKQAERWVDPDFPAPVFQAERQPSLAAPASPQ